MSQLPKSANAKHFDSKYFTPKLSYTPTAQPQQNADIVFVDCIPGCPNAFTCDEQYRDETKDVTFAGE